MRLFLSQTLRDTQARRESSANTATTKAGEASTSATNAASSASAASASATAAAGSASAAAASKSNAAASATSASGSATQAATSASTAQAAQAAAEAVLESIPEDYSELSADVDDLKNALKQNTKSLDVTNWEVGGIGSNGDNYTARSTSIFTIMYLDSTNILSLECEDGSLAYVAFYDSSKTFIWRNAITATKVDVQSLTGYSSSTYLRIELADTSIEDYEKLQIEYTLSSEIEEISSEIEEIEDEVFGGTKTFCALANGTLTNSGNVNAVNTVTRIPCGKGDIVELFPARANISGYYYMYTYSIYDSSGNVLTTKSAASENNKCAYISNDNAAYIRFAIFEYNGTEYNPLRYSTYETTPYARVGANNSLRFDVDTLNSEIEDLNQFILKYLYVKNIDIEIGVNRYLENGIIKVVNNVRRASTEPTESTDDEALFIVADGYWLAIYAYNGSGWFEYLTNRQGTFVADFTGVNSYFCQTGKTDSSAISSDAVPFVMRTSLQSKIDGMDATLFRASYEADALWNLEGAETVELGNGTIVNPSNAVAVNTTNYIPVTTGGIAKCNVLRPVDDDEYKYFFAYAEYDENKNLVTQNTAATEDNNEVQIPLGVAYIRFAIFQTDGNGNFIALRTTNISNSEVVVKVSNESDSGNPYADNKKAEAKIIRLKKINGEAYGDCDAKFLFVTDIHKEVLRTLRAVSLANSWGSDYISAVINGGDTVQTTITESLDWYYAITDMLEMPLLNTVGNHDAWASLGVLETDPTVVYAKIIEPIVSQSDIVQPNNAESNGYNYYYKDFNETVRVIVIDCMFWDATQLAWFVATLEDAKTNGLHVIAVSHAAFPWANMETVDCLWSKAGLLTGYSDSGARNDPTRTNLQAAQAVKDFIDAGGTFICWLTGHQHGDDVHILPDYGNQFVVTMSSFAQRASMLQKSTSVTDYNYDCLTYIAVDTSNTAIKFLRIGADIDMYGVKHNGLSIKYGDSPKLIASW